MLFIFVLKFDYFMFVWMADCLVEIEVVDLLVVVLGFSLVLVVHLVEILAFCFFKLILDNSKIAQL